MMTEFNIEKRFGDFCLKVREQFGNEIIGVFGESGAGKSTLLHCFIGYLSPHAGFIRINGRTVFSSSEKINCPIEKRNIGIVSQDGLLFPHLSVKQNILYNTYKQDDDILFEELVALLNLNTLLLRTPASLSGGEKQRVAIARSLMHTPQLLMMDEPVCSVDLKSRFEIMDYLRGLHRRMDIPLIYVSHSISELLYLADKLFILHQGQSLAFGEPLDLLAGRVLDNVSGDVDIKNVFYLQVLDNNRKDMIALLDFFGQPLRVASRREGSFGFLRVQIGSRDIIVSVEKPGKISARNVITATLERIVVLQEKVILYANINGKICFVEITSSALRELGLIEGMKVYLIIKTRSILVFN